jgi:hypothetical protein
MFVRRNDTVYKITLSEVNATESYTIIYKAFNIYSLHFHIMITIGYKPLRSLQITN